MGVLSVQNRPVAFQNACKKNKFSDKYHLQFQDVILILESVEFTNQGGFR